jgi:ABC-type branched-subunit amino acid transport system substrate-binding protein
VAESYDGVKMLAKAIETANSTDPKKIADALRTMEYKGVCEDYKADVGQGLHHSTYVDQFNADGVAQSKKKVEVPAS